MDDGGNSDRFVFTGSLPAVLIPRSFARRQQPEPPEPAPRKMRDVFDLLGRLRVGESLDGLIARIDFSGTAPRQIEALLRGRSSACGTEAQDAAAAFRQGLLSPEFRTHAVPAFLAAFPELKRQVFVHIPKSAGTDLNMNLRRCMLDLPVDKLELDWISDDDFIAGLAGLARAAPLYDQVFVHGHINLGAFMSRRARRPADNVFSIVRDPIAAMVSQANYKIGRLRDDPGGLDADTAETLTHLGLTRLPAGISDRGLKDLAVRALLDPAIVTPNLACWHLGDGGAASFESAMFHIAASDVELTTVGSYQAWLRRRWDVRESEHHNRSVTLLTEHEARRRYSAVLTAATAEDQVLFDFISWAIDSAGTDSVSGRQLARLAAPMPVVPFGRRMAARWPRARCDSLRPPFVVEEPPFVALFLHSPPIGNVSAVQMREVLSETFGTGGTGNACLGAGWSGLEDGFVWTNGTVSSLLLPPCPGEGTLAARLIGTPFVAGTGLPAQDIVLSVNGQRVGTATVRDFAVIEFDIPASVAGLDEWLELTIQIPGARRASAVNGEQDERVLGFALRQAIVLRYVSETELL